MRFWVYLKIRGLKKFLAEMLQIPSIIYKTIIRMKLAWIKLS